VKVNEKSQIIGDISSSKKAALTGIMAALIAVTTIIAIPLPPPLSTINLAPVVIFVVSILLGPSIGLTATVIGCSVGYLAGTSLGTIVVPPGLLYLYLVGLVVARGPMALIAGFLRKKSEAVGMTLGVIFETVMFFSIDFTLFGIGYAIFDLGTFVDLIFVPITLVVLISLRRVFSTKYLA
jgi:uncharacterized membrane protein